MTDIENWTPSFSGLANTISAAVLPQVSRIHPVLAGPEHLDHIVVAPLIIESWTSCGLLILIVNLLTVSVNLGWLAPYLRIHAILCCS